MARRIRIPIKVTVKYQAQVRYRQQTTFRPVPMPLPPRPQLLTSSHRLTTRSPIREIRDNAIEYADAAGLPEAEHDLFIIHASEDQADLVAPLAQLLTDADLSIWYSGFVMKPGMSLTVRNDLAGAQDYAPEQLQPQPRRPVRPEHRQGLG